MFVLLCFVLTVLWQDFFELFVVGVQSGQTLGVDDLLQGSVSKPDRTEEDI